MKKRRRQVNLRQRSALTAISDKNGVAVFIAFLIAVVFLLDSAQDQKALNSPLEDERAEANAILSKLVFNSATGSGVGFVVTSPVDPAMFDSLAEEEYGQVKLRLGVKNDFVIHFEDSEGNVVPIGSRMCIGPATATIRGIPCDTLSP